MSSPLRDEFQLKDVYFVFIMTYRLIFYGVPNGGRKVSEDNRTFLFSQCHTYKSCMKGRPYLEA
jgi:hypothetical protein